MGVIEESSPVRERRRSSLEEHVIGREFGDGMVVTEEMVLAASDVLWDFCCDDMGITTTDLAAVVLAEAFRTTSSDSVRAKTRIFEDPELIASNLQRCLQG